MGETIYTTLFSPFELAGQTLRNRLCHASILTQMAQGGQPTQAMINYFAARARGGCAMIVTEPLAMISNNPNPGRLRVYDDQAMDGLTRVAEAVRSEGCHLLGQIQDPGRGRHEVGRNDGAIGASALPDDLSWTVPRELSAAEIRGLIVQWAESSLRLKRAGFSGVEISAGHGHLFHQFFSPWSNRREDEFGGDLEGRCRLVCELLAAVREACGSDFIIGVKLPGDDGVAGSIDLPLAGDIARQVAATGIADYWTFCWGAHARSLYQHLPDAFGERHPFLDNIRELRGAGPEIPTGALGYITDPNECETALTDGTAELVFLGRPLITDAYFGRKAESGAEATIRYCVSCNTCWRSIIEFHQLRCDNNPRVGEADELSLKPAITSSPRRIAVIGSGIAGLEAAQVAARAGHEVTVYGASGEPGGKTRVHAMLPGGENLSSIYDYQYLTAKAAGARFELDGAVTPARVADIEADVVLLATGSSLSVPDWISEEWREMGAVPDLRELAADLLAQPRPTDGTLLIEDRDHTEMTYAAAQFFASQFERIVIVTPRERIASDVSLINRQGIYQRLAELGVVLKTSLEVADLDNLDEAEVNLRNVYTGNLEKVDDIVGLTYASPRLPNLDLYPALKEKPWAVIRVGDCAAPRGVLAATSEGDRVARSL
ncbi:MAG: FAD-dependent oxidoreductase [Pseudomonadota bacterium]